MTKLNDKEIEELFKSAPDDAEYYYHLSDCYHGAWIKVIRVNSYQYIIKGNENKGWRINNGGITNVGITNTGELIPRPTKTSKLIYTKEMANNGELPVVGMECNYETSFFTSKTSTSGLCTVIAFFEGKVWLDMYSTDFVINLNVIEFKPIDTRTDAEKAAEEYATEYAGSDFVKTQIEDAFKAGVTWSESK